MDTLLTCSHWPQQPERLSRVWGKRDLTDALAPVMQRIFVVQLSVDTMIGFRMACDTPDRLLISCPTAGCCQGSLLSTIQITLCRTVADPFDAATTDLRNNPLPCHSAAPSFGSRASFCRTMTAMPCSMAIVSRCISSSRRSWAAASAAACAFCADTSACGRLKSECLVPWTTYYKLRRQVPGIEDRRQDTSSKEQKKNLV